MPTTRTSTRSASSTHSNGTSSSGGGRRSSAKTSASSRSKVNGVNNEAQGEEQNGARAAKGTKRIKEEQDDDVGSLAQSDHHPSTSPAAKKQRGRGVKKEEEGGGGEEESSPAAAAPPVKAENADEQDEKKPPPKTLADRKLQLHRSSAGKSPFPRWPGPSAQEAERVAWLLGRWHGYKPEAEGGRGLPRFTPPKGEDKWGGCGDVKDVLDATVRTLLSCNTSGKNSSAAHASMTKRFGRNNWKSILEAPQKELEEALRCGGLANVKSKNIQNLLRQTQERYGELSLQHLHDKPDAEVLETLISFQGVGPKVASCVLAFCLGRPSMAVDTHVQRLSLSLGWVPPNSSREQTYYHLNERVPPELRYPLHVLLISHGKACSNCRAKGGGGGGGSKSPAKKQVKKEESEDEREDNSDGEEAESKNQNRPCPLRENGLLGRKFKLLPEEDVQA